MKIILFEDQHITKLYPITLTRAAFDIRCGGLTLFEALRRVFPEASFDFFVREHLVRLVERDHKLTNAAQKSVLFLNAAVVPDIQTLRQLAQSIEAGKDFIIKEGDRVVAMYSTVLDIYVRLSLENIVAFIQEQKVPVADSRCVLFKNVWDIVVFNQQILKANLVELAQGLSEMQPEVFVGASVTVETPVTFDTSHGPIVIADHVTVRAYTVLRGPLSIGPGCIISSHAEIKGNTCLGPVCKIGGEVEATVIQGYSNKAHYGFLGHSYLGEWVNLGGGTTASNMKNTYGKVKMAGLETDQQFLGCVLGDYVKTAVNTAIFTGKLVGPSSMLYGYVTDNVPAFTNSVFREKLIEVPLEVSHKLQKASRDRRAIDTDHIDQQLLADVYEVTVEDRTSASVKKGSLVL